MLLQERPVPQYVADLMKRMPDAVRNNDMSSNGILSVGNQGACRPNIVSNGKPIMVRSLYSDVAHELDARDLGEPWNDSANPFAPNGYKEYWNFDGYKYCVAGEDIVVIPVANPWTIHYRLMMPLIRNESGVYVQHYGLPLENNKYANMRYTSEDQFDIQYGTIRLGSSVLWNKMYLYGKVAADRYAEIKIGDISVIELMAKYYAKYRK